MAKATVTEPAFVASLIAALRQKFSGAEVSYEHVRGIRYRFIVQWDHFDSLGHPERQKQVWKIAEEALGKADLLNVSMILTLSRSDVEVEKTL